MKIVNRAVLLPCPFCGGEADIHHMPDGAHAQCYECEANSRIFDGVRDGKGADREFAHEDAFEAWNTRISHSLPGEPAAWMYERGAPFPVRYIHDVRMPAYLANADGWTETPLYAALTPATGQSTTPLLEEEV